jgi:hypothetical protein
VVVVALRRNTASKYGVEIRRETSSKWVEISEVSRRISTPYFLVTWMTSRKKIRRQNTV